MNAHIQSAAAAAAACTMSCDAQTHRCIVYYIDTYSFETSSRERLQYRHVCLKQFSATHFYGCYMRCQLLMQLLIYCTEMMKRKTKMRIMSSDVFVPFFAPICNSFVKLLPLFKSNYMNYLEMLLIHSLRLSYVFFCLLGFKYALML